MVKQLLHGVAKKSFLWAFCYLGKKLRIVWFMEFSSPIPLCPYLQTQQNEIKCSLAK